MHRPDCAPTILPAPPGVPGEVVGVGFPAGAVVGAVVRVGVGVAALSALSTEVYAAFLLPPLPKSNGLSLERHESLSRTPHTVMPAQRATFMHAVVSPAYCDVDAL